MEQLNTHFYDGKIKTPATGIDPHIRTAALVSRAQKMEAFAALRQKLATAPGANPITQHNLNVIISTYATQGRTRSSANYDATNDLYADDILYVLCEIVRTHPDHDTLGMINMELSDMTSGMCPQGRTHRLFDIARAFI